MFEPVAPEHLTAIAEINRVCGFPERSPEGWKWVLFDNPEQGDEPAGYVAIRKSKVVGFTGTHRRILRAGDRKISIVAGHTLITDLNGPGIGFKLARHTLKAHGADVVVTLNNNALSAPLYPRIGMEPWLGESGRVALERTLDWPAVLTGSARRKMARADSEEALRSVPEYGLQSVTPSDAPPVIEGLSLLDPEAAEDAEILDDFSDRMSQSEVFQPDRSARIWRYRQSDPDHRGAMFLYGLKDKGRLSALVAVSIGKDTKFSPACLEIEDMSIAPGMRMAPLALLRIPEAFARQMRLARVRMRRVPNWMQAQLSGLKGWRVRHRNYDSCHVHAKDRGILDQWDPGPMESDFFFALRRMPHLAEAGAGSVAA